MGTPARRELRKTIAATALSGCLIAPSRESKATCRQQAPAAQLLRRRTALIRRLRGARLACIRSATAPAARRGFEQCGDTCLITDCHLRQTEAAGTCSPNPIGNRAPIVGLLTGSREAATRAPFPQNVACGFPAPRSSAVEFTALPMPAAPDTGGAVSVAATVSVV